MIRRLDIKVLHIIAEDLQSVMVARATHPLCAGLYNQQLYWLNKFKEEYALMSQELKNLGADDIPLQPPPLPPYTKERKELR